MDDRKELFSKISTQIDGLESYVRLLSRDTDPDYIRDYIGLIGWDIENIRRHLDTIETNTQ